MSEKEGISGGSKSAELPKTGLYNSTKAPTSAGSKGVQQMCQRRVVSASMKRPQKQPQPHHPPVVVRRIHGEVADSKGGNTGLDGDSRGRVHGEQPSKSKGPSRRTGHAAFDCGPPPQLNTIKRLAKEVNECAADLNTARGEAESDEVGWLGRQMANAKLSSSLGYASRLAKAAARKVDYEGDQRVYTSLANISVASTSSDYGLVGLAWKKTSASKRDPELKLENYFTLYLGQDFTYTPQSKEAVLELVKPCQRPPKKPFRIQDHVDL